MPFLYTLALQAYALLLRLLSPFVPKAAQWTAGRRGLLTHIRQTLQPDAAPRVWFHCASLGEFEQGRPLMEAFAQQYPTHKIVLTFFSPSGYEVRKNWPGAAYVFYLPLDTAANARAFVEAVQPQLAVFVKYEFWYHFLTVLNQRRIPTICVSAIFRPQQAFFKPWGGFFRQILGRFTHIFTQNEASVQLLHSAEVTQASIAGDTRFDTVVATAAAPHKLLPLLEAFVASDTAHKRPVLVVGSSWPEDISVLAPALQRLISDAATSGLRVIVAPHELHESGLQQIEAVLPGQTVRYSRATPATAASARLLLIDSIGLLRDLYRYGSFAYIGGAFGKGLHNTLEAAAFGLPLVFGPRYAKFQEAIDLITLGGAHSVTDSAQLETVLRSWLRADQPREAESVTNRQYVIDHAGATPKIMTALSQWFHPEAVNS
ncbi:3-deoxy-D-manno-octulosonic acid transferase [Hymenobacter sp. BT491]|nr:3-deoxy-D-manno-octulosonic acid transferase [Hymenobacter sp. BT491]